MTLGRKSGAGAAFFPLEGGRMALWLDAERAFKTWERRFPGDTLERVAARGGFRASEFAYFLRGLFPEGPSSEWPVDRCGACRGLGEVPMYEGGGYPAVCGMCWGAGVLVPASVLGKESP